MKHRENDTVVALRSLGTAGVERRVATQTLPGYYGMSLGRRSVWCAVSLRSLCSRRLRAQEATPLKRNTRDAHFFMEFPMFPRINIREIRQSRLRFRPIQFPLAISFVYLFGAEAWSIFVKLNTYYTEWSETIGKLWQSSERRDRNFRLFCWG